MRLVISTMKDEGPFILEWIAYYLSIGFTNFIINSNNCSDGTDKILIRLQEMGLVAHIDNPEPWPRGPQASAYSNAKAHPWYKEAEWVFVCDADEFLDIKVGDGTLDALFAEAPKANAFSFVWLLFGHGGVERFEDKFITEQFNYCANPRQTYPAQCRAFKTLFRNAGIFKDISTHRPRSPYFNRVKEIDWLDADGREMGHKFSRFGWNFSCDGVGFGDRLGRLNHYAIRSVETFFMKRLRGDVNTTSVHGKLDGTGLNYLKLHCWNNFESASIQGHLSQHRHYFDRLMRDLYLRQMHESACDFHIKQIALMRQKSGFNELINEFAKFSAESAETSIRDQALMSSEISLAKSNFELINPVKMINHHRLLEYNRVMNLITKNKMSAESSDADLSNDLKPKLVEMPNSVDQATSSVLQRNEDPPSSRKPKRDFANAKLSSPFSANSVDDRLTNQQAEVFSKIAKPCEMLLIGMQNPLRISKICEIVDPNWMGVISSWGSHLMTQRKWGREEYAESAQKRTISDQKFVDTLGAFNKDINDHRLSFYRAQPHTCLRLFDPESIDIVYFHGKYRKRPLLISLEDALSKLRPGGHIIIDAYKKLKPNSIQQDSMLTTIHQFLSEHSSELRIAEVTGTLLRIQKLPPM